ncbi:MAG: hypothetical protein ACUVWR_13510 [Anaerolineae bacterium]
MAGDYAYVITDEQLRILSLADKAHPAQVGWRGLPDSILEAVHVAGDYAYIAAWDGAHILSVANKASPSPVAYFNTAGTGKGIDADGSYVYVADGRNGLVILRLTSDVFGLTLSPASDGKSGSRAATVAYTLRVANNGNTTDTFSVSVVGNSWTTDAPATVGPLSAGASADFTVQVHIPQGAASGSSDRAAVTLTSQGDRSQSAASSLTTTVASASGVCLPMVIRTGQ